MIVTPILASLVISASCSWDNPGANRWSGLVPSAVHHYTDIPLDVRNRLQARMEKTDYDDIAEIKKDSIKGKSEYVNLRDMHFGENRLCKTVSMDKWLPDAVERGLVYCETTHCIIVPTVCGNVSRVTRLKVTPPAAVTGPISGPVAPIAIVPTLPPFGGDVGPGGSTPTSTTVAPPTFETVSRTPSAAMPPPIWWSPYPPPIYWHSYQPPIFLPPIPEPSTWMMLLAGVAAILYLARRRKPN